MSRKFTISTCTIEGMIKFIRDETPRGLQIEMECDENHSYSVIIFHINTSNPLYAKQHFSSGEIIEKHATASTFSDIEVRDKYGELHSAFVFMDEELLYRYNLSLETLDLIQIAREERDAYPANCTNDRETLQNHAEKNADAPDDWYYLQ